MKTQPFQFGLTNVTCVTPVPISNSIFHIDVLQHKNLRHHLHRNALTQRDKIYSEGVLGDLGKYKMHTKSLKYIKKCDKQSSSD